MQQALFDRNMWQKASSNMKEKILALNHSVERWVLPSPSWNKINFDLSFKVNTKLGVAVVVAKDHNGYYMGGKN